MGSIICGLVFGDSVVAKKEDPYMRGLQNYCVALLLNGGGSSLYAGMLFGKVLQMIFW